MWDDIWAICEDGWVWAPAAQFNAFKLGRCQTRNITASSQAISELVFLLDQHSKIPISEFPRIFRYTFAQCTQRGADVHKCALDCNQFSLRQCTVSQSLYHWYYQTLVKGETWGNCNKRLLSIQERCLRLACQYHIWLHLSLSLQRNFLKFVKPHITTVTQDCYHSTVQSTS